MKELENKLVEKILEKIDMDKLTDKIAEKAAELIVQKEYPNSPVTPQIVPKKPWMDIFTPVMYGTIPTEFDSNIGKEFIDDSVNTK